MTGGVGLRPKPSATVWHPYQDACASKKARSSAYKSFAVCGTRSVPATLGENRLLHDARYIGQPEIAPREAVGEAFVVEAEEVQHGGVEVVDVDSVFDRAEA